MEVIKSVWDFFQNEILGMAWLYRLIGGLLSSLGLDTSEQIGGSILFFVYDMIKIMVLLGVLIFIISYIQSYFPPERTKKILGRFHGIGANIIAALLGTVIPLFIGFTRAGLPLGVTFSFLISSPMVDLGSLVLLMSIFGWKVALIYVAVGLVIAVVGGTLIEKLHLDNQVEDFIRNGKAIDIPQQELHFKDRLKYAWKQVCGTAKKGISLCSYRRCYRRCYPQLDTAGFNHKRSGRQQSFRRCYCNGCRYPDVCGYFRNDSDSRGSARQGSIARRCTFVYDGGNYAVASVNDNAQKSGQAKAARHLHCYLHGGNNYCRLCVQRIAEYLNLTGGT